VRQGLRDKELLLVLDPFDHLLEAAPLLGALARAAPRLKLLITSREPLNLYGEHHYDVPPLDRGDVGGRR
jgi:predicted ATPase